MELEKYNQSILTELERTKQNISASASTPMFAMPEDNNFSVFEDAFKTYVEGTEKYKSKIEEKDKEIDELR